MKARYLYPSLLVLASLLVPLGVSAQTVALVPNTTFPGGEVLLIGLDLPSKQDYILRIDGAYFSSGVTLLNGTLNRQLTLPRTLSLGNHTMNLTSDGVTALANFTVVQWPVEIWVTPSVIRPGTMAYFHGAGYPPNAAYSVYLDGERIASGPTDATGGFADEYLLPKTMALGPHNVSAAATQHFGPPTANTTMDVVQWEIEAGVTPSVTNAGITITVTGSGLPPWSLFKVFLDGNEIVSGQSDLQGYLQRTHILPTAIPLGAHEIAIRAYEYTDEPTGSFIFDVVQWPVQFTVDPPSARSGEPVSFEGLGYPPGCDVRIFMDGQQVRSGTADAQGEFRISYVLPKSVTVGVHAADARAPAYSGPPTASSTITVEPWTPALSVRPAFPHPGQTLTANGSGYPPSATCHIYLDSGLVNTLVTDSDGEFLMTIPLARDTSFGIHEVRASAVNHAGPPSSAGTVAVTQWPLAVFTNTTNITKGSALDINGTGFPPSTGVRVYWDGSYIKAGSTDGDGELHLQMFINYQNDQSFHTLMLNVTDTYRGPPSVFALIWLGSDPPQPIVQTLDSGLSQRASYYHDEEVFVNGSGFPPLLDIMMAVVEGDPAMGDSIDPVAQATVRTDSQGRFPASLLWAADRAGNFTIAADLNGNMILDNSDYLLPGALRLVARPDAAVLEISTDVDSPVQGQTIQVSVVAANQGGSPADVNISLAVDSQTPWVLRVLGLEPGENATLIASVDTGSLAVGAHLLSGSVGVLPDETDVTDNLAQMGLNVLSRPDIEVRSVLPGQETYRIGDEVVVSVVVRNRGDRPESFDVQVLLNSVQVAGDSVARLQPGTDHHLELLWDTAAGTPGNYSLSVAAEVLPYEEQTANNLLTYGTLTLLPPNQVPVADAGGPYQGQRTMLVVFDGSGSYDTDGEIASYAWDFGDGQTGTGPNPVHAYDDLGTYQVSLTVTDDLGAIDTGTTTCTVTEILCALEISVNDSPTGAGLAGSTARVGSRDFLLPQGHLVVAGLEKGDYLVWAFKAGYTNYSIDLRIEGNSSLSISLDPICEIRPANSTGGEKYNFSSDESVYVSVVSPGNYYGRVYVVSPGDLPNATVLRDATGQGYVTSQFVPGVTLIAAWLEGLQDGTFQAILDLDGDGVLNLAYDRVSDGFTVPETALPVFALFLATPAMLKGRFGRARKRG